jgi:hypothetical protein
VGCPTFAFEASAISLSATSPRLLFGQHVSHAVQQRVGSVEQLTVTYNGLVHARHHVGAGWVVDSYEQPVSPHLQSFDASLVTARPGVIRLGAFDAAVNVLSDDAELRALTAVHTLRGHLAVTADPEEAVNTAHQVLHDPTLRPRHHNPMASAAVVDLDPTTGDVAARRYGDCEVWVRGAATNGYWVSLFPGDMLTLRARTAYEDALTTLPGGESAWAVQEATLDEPTAWVTPPVGLMDELTPQRSVIYGCDEVIVSSDGARLTAELCEQLREWITVGIQQLPDGWPYPSAHGDLTVLHAYRA